MGNLRILVTGSTGFVGSQLCRELLKRGSLVLGTQRIDGDSQAGKRNEISKIGTTGRSLSHTIDIGNIGPETDWTPVLVGVDAVVHLAARVHIMHDTADDPLAEFRKVNVEGTRQLAETAARVGVKRLVFLSSVKVNGETTDASSEDPKDLVRLGQPFRETDSPQPEDAYGISKWEAEQALRETEVRTGLEVVIIRPTLIYGPGVKANFLNLIKLVERGMPLPFGGIRNKRSLLSLTNLVDLICRCLVHEAAAGETFLASDGDDVSTPELVRRIAAAVDKPVLLLPVPQWLMNFGGKMTGKSNEVKRLCGSLQVDSSKVRQVLRWSPPCTMEEELGRLAAWRASQM